MDTELLRSKAARPVNIRIASVRNFALRIGQRATLIPAKNSTVYGMLMELTHGEIDRLYSEPSVREYRPEPVLADLPDGSHVSGLCFNLPIPPKPGEANPDYAAKLRDLASRLGLPPGYVNKIR